MSNFQREGSISNAHVGKDFEKSTFQYFSKRGIILKTNYAIPLGTGKIKKEHRFDLGGQLDNGLKIIVECKSHRWTTGGNVPSAKLTVWNEVMLYFSLLKKEDIKILFVLKDFSEKKNLSLAEYYASTYKHLVSEGVAIIEYDVSTMQATKVFGKLDQVQEQQLEMFLK